MRMPSIPLEREKKAITGGGAEGERHIGGKDDREQDQVLW